jgi:type 2 lantibiotic biosynthesis protein LanM
MRAAHQKTALNILRTEYASYLHERVPLHSPPDLTAEAAERLTAWRGSAYLSEEKFSKRLQSTGCRPGEFAELLGDGEFSVPPAATSWVEELGHLLGRPRPNSPLGVTAKLYAVRFDRLPFSSLLEPLLHGYSEALIEQASADPEIVGSGIPLDILREGMLEALADRLLEVCGRTLILELNVARIHGRLQGEDAEARYDWYDNELLRDPEYLEQLFTEYPVLGRSLVECGRAWQVYAMELLQRLARDVSPLRESGLLLCELSGLTGITADLGDPHAHGRTVARLSFQDGSQLIYKPRPVQPEQAYAEVAEAMQHLGAPCARAGRCLARDGYGWCEFIERQPCDDEEDIAKFYRKAGGTLAVLLFLGAGDMHMENVIPSGTDLVPIDLETLLQPRALTLASRTAHEKAMDILDLSVLGIGMLPARVFGKAQGKGVDVSALGGGVPQEAPTKVPRVVDPFTDRMRIEPLTGMMQSVGNRPWTRDHEYGPGEFTSSIMDGFRAAYWAIVEHRQVFADILRGFSDCPVRYLARPTRRYGLFLTESYHPKYLRDGRDRDRLLEKLWTVIEGREDMIPLVESERVQLLRGDIPVFHSRPGSTDLFSGSSKVASGFFLGSSLESLLSRLNMFGAQHFEAQLRIVSDTLGAHRAQQSSWTGTKPARGKSVPETTTDELLELNRKYMDGLVNTAIYGSDNDCTWIGIRLNGLEEDAFDYRGTGTSVYDGLAGMTLAFIEAAGAHGSDKYLEMAQRCATPVIRHLQDVERNDLSQPVGAFSGIGGSLYVLDRLARLTGDSQYHDHLWAALPSVLRSAKNETFNELVTGLAGCMSVTAGLYRHYPDAALREVTAICAERLHDGAVREGDAASWPIEEGRAALTGFSHGASGIAWALLEAAEVLGEDLLRHDALAAFEFERRYFAPEHGTWEDLREEDVAGTAEARLRARWCHGAGGIGLARLLAMRHLDDPRIVDEARTALRATEKLGFGATHSLCHGDFGNLELFELAARVLPADEAAHWRSVRGERARASVAALVDRGPVCGVAPGVEMSGLMLGVAGIALGLLRLARTEPIPSVLWLESPRTA